MSARDVCRSCGAPIGWARTDKGHSIPIDLPNPEGSLYVFYEGEVRRVSTKLPEHPGLVVSRADSHFATCPSAARHRRSRSR